MTIQDVRDLLERMAAEEPLPLLDAEPLARRARRRAVRSVLVGAIGVAAAVAMLLGAGSLLPDRPSNPPAIDPTPTDPDPRTAGEVLWLDPSNGVDLLAVNAVTGEERVLVEGIRGFEGAAPSADGRWVAYEKWSGPSLSLWVRGPEGEPRKVTDLPDYRSWAWSPTGARLVVDRGPTLSVVDPATGRVTDLGSMGGVDAPPAWSPDGTTILLGATDGMHAVDVRTGDRSLVVQLPGEDFGPVRAITWSPDGSRLAVYRDDVADELGSGDGRLFLLDADGSNIRVLAQGEFVPSSFDWSPDGSRIAFAELFGLSWRIWIAPGDGSTPSTTVTPESSDLWGPPAWSPDGSQVAYSLSPGQAIVIAADGSGDAEPIDDLTYASWNGGSFHWAWWFRTTPSYTGPRAT